MHTVLVLSARWFALPPLRYICPKSRQLAVTREVMPVGLCFKQSWLATMMCRMLGRLRRCAIAGAVASRASGELGTLLVFSLAGLDLSGWLFVEGWLRPSGALVKTFLLLG